VLLVGMPGLLRDIIGRVLQAQPDMQIVGDLPAADNLDHFTRKEPPDVVVFGAVTEAISDACQVLIRAVPKTKLLGIAPSGRRSVLCTLSVQTVELGELSPEELAAVIRNAALGP